MAERKCLLSGKTSLSAFRSALRLTARKDNGTGEITSVEVPIMKSLIRLSQRLRSKGTFFNSKSRDFLP